MIFTKIYLVSNKTKYAKAKITLRSNVLRYHFCLPEVDIQVQNGHGTSEVPCLELMELVCKVLIGHFRPVYLLQVRDHWNHSSITLSKSWVGLKKSKI